VQSDRIDIGGDAATSAPAPRATGAKLLLGLVLNTLATALQVLSKSVHRVAGSEQRDPRGDSYGQKLVHHDHLPQGKGNNVSREPRRSYPEAFRVSGRAANRGPGIGANHERNPNTDT
jgi:hypothetical protein